MRQRPSGGIQATGLAPEQQAHEPREAQHSPEVALVDGAVSRLELGLGGQPMRVPETLELSVGDAPGFQAHTGLCLHPSDARVLDRRAANDVPHMTEKAFRHLASNQAGLPVLHVDAEQLVGAVPEKPRDDESCGDE